MGQIHVAPTHDRKYQVVHFSKTGEWQSTSYHHTKEEAQRKAARLRKVLKVGK